MSVHPKVLQHHEDMHKTMNGYKKQFSDSVETHKDYIDHHFINKVKEYNNRTELMIKDHNNEVRKVANDLNTPFKALKNKYQIHVPAIGKCMQ